MIKFKLSAIVLSPILVFPLSCIVLRAVSNNAEGTEAPDDAEVIRGDRTTAHYLDDVNKARKKAGKDPIKYKKYLLFRKRY